MVARWASWRTWAPRFDCGQVGVRQHISAETYDELRAMKQPPTASSERGPKPPAGEAVPVSGMTASAAGLTARTSAAEVLELVYRHRLLATRQVHVLHSVGKFGGL